MDDINLRTSRRLPAIRLAPTTISSRRDVIPGIIANRSTGAFLIFSLFAVLVVGRIASAGATTGISYLGARSSANGYASSITVDRPTEAVAGSFLLAGLYVRGYPAITTPNGWTLVRADDRGFVYSRVTASSEPASYTWTFDKARAAIVGMMAYAGVDTTSPVLDSAGQTNPRSTQIPAPALSQSADGSVVVAFFAQDRTSTIAPPAGTVGRTGTGSPAGQPQLTLLVAEAAGGSALTKAGLVAVASRAGTSVAQVVDLNPAASASGGGSPPAPGVFRAFSPTSYWNTMLPADVAIDPNSSAYVQYLKKNIVGDFVMLSGADSNGEWGVAVYWAADGDSTYDVRSTRYSVPPEFASLRIPHGAKPDPTSDAEMMVYDFDKGYVAGLWEALYDPATDSWTAGGGDIYYLASNGLDGSLSQSDEPRNSGAHRGAAPPIYSIRYDEVEAGQIDHVIKVAIPGPSSRFVFPMTGSDGKATDPAAPPEGARMRLKRSVDLSTMHLTPAQYAVAKAAQDYGFVVTDGSGAPVSAGVENVVAEGRGWLWNSVLTWDSLRPFSLSDYEFVTEGYGQ